jgi:hypothetical protein
MNRTPTSTPRKESQTLNRTPIKSIDPPNTTPVQQMKASDPSQCGQSKWSLVLKFQPFVYIFTAVLFFVLYMVRNDYKSLYAGGSVVAFVLFGICMVVHFLFERKLKTN